MKAKILQKSLIVTGMLSGFISVASFADEEAMSFSFETVPDVSIVQTQALDFGDNLAINVGSTCTLRVTATDVPGSLDARMGLTTTATTATTNYQTRTGNCDDGTGTTTGTAGIYTISGAGGIDINITLNSIIAASDTEFSFSPTGVVVDNVAPAGASAQDSVFVGLTADASSEARLPSAVDPGYTSGNPIPGQTFVYVGGTLTAQKALEAGRTYDTQTFIIDVVYN